MSRWNLVSLMACWNAPLEEACRGSKCGKCRFNFPHALHSLSYRCARMFQFQSMIVVACTCIAYGSVTKEHSWWYGDLFHVKHLKSWKENRVKVWHCFSCLLSQIPPGQEIIISSSPTDRLIHVWISKCQLSWIWSLCLKNQNYINSMRECNYFWVVEG